MSLALDTLNAFIDEVAVAGNGIATEFPGDWQRSGARYANGVQLDILIEARRRIIAAESKALEAVSADPRGGAR